MPTLVITLIVIQPTIMKVKKNVTKMVISSSPWFVTNEQLHRDLQMKTVHQAILLHTKIYQKRVKNHPNSLVRALMEENQIIRGRKPNNSQT